MANDLTTSQLTKAKDIFRKEDKIKVLRVALNGTKDLVDRYIGGARIQRAVNTGVGVVVAGVSAIVDYEIGDFSVGSMAIPPSLIGGGIIRLGSEFLDKGNPDSVMMSNVVAAAGDSALNCGIYSVTRNKWASWREEA